MLTNNEFAHKGMSVHKHPDLDLQDSIRPGLDILANEIVIALKKRTRFARNEPLYQPGLVRSDRSISLLLYALNREERCHAELGRYTFASQESFTDVSMIESVINRDSPISPIIRVPSKVGGKILRFYQQWIAEACVEGDEPNSYGETVTADVNALLSIMERINLGKLVAESKYLELADEFRATRGNRDEMLALIVRKDREKHVLDIATRLAEHYHLETNLAIKVFDFMIETTVDVEVDYLQMRLRGAGY
jgi:chorismate mutase